MNIFLTGGTGFIGQALVKALLAEGHYLTILTRQSLPKTSFPQAVKFCQNLDEFRDFNQFDAVINLAGEPIFDKSWSKQQKQILLNSRIQLTAELARLINASEHPPHTFLSGSATGFYGDLDSVANFYTESTACGANFSAMICEQWEQQALLASSKTRVCLLRTGIVLAEHGGALAKMLPLYRLNLAGKLGSGKQYWAWISLEDHIQAVLFLLKNAKCHGAFNLVAPKLITNSEFNRKLATFLKRYAIFAVPSFMLRLLLGERSQLLLDNQPLVPKKLLDAGFKFTCPHLDFSQILK
ncbi:TIGR01777 family oxidoreductase [Actinobacillus genomosp. 2]|uniref:TIGR01777 family oxidoreductase n=1 Tax=Actinobacillus genomosp. 2 TaxID=230709 RepID=UPI0024414151|nr:TIGR01777 family oxidoreductase [Actinobacillus genomosp. 2]WGE32083.1 TIGR01777 family oxidoreductase [Actinobacillus genomosp. 2]